MAIIGLTTVGGSCTILATSNSESVLGLKRQGRFWMRVAPVVFDYYWNFASSSPNVRFRKASTELRNRMQQEQKDKDNNTSTTNSGTLMEKKDADESLHKMHERHAPEILGVMLDLKGLYIKLGQVLSVTALPIPEEYRVLFRTLQSDVPGWEQFEETIKPILEEELGVKDLKEVFSEIDPVPCGAASIGQAHRAKLRESGEDVVVKVQYPDASWQVPSDIQCVGSFLRLCVWAGAVEESAAKLSFDEFSRQFIAELDYNAEQQNLKEVHCSSIQSDAPYQTRGVVVPKVYEKFCTGKVITMSFLPGRKLEEEAKRQLEMMGFDTSKGVRGVIMRDDTHSEVESKEKRLTGSGNFLRGPALLFGRLVGLDSILWTTRFVNRIVLWSKATAATAIRVAALLLPQLQDRAKASEFAFLQAAQLALTESWIDALLDVHGHQIFHLGLFNADPHPGNILVLEENNGVANQSLEKKDAGHRLGLIDYGQCKRLSPEDQAKVAQLVLSVANNESDEQIAKAFRQLGVQTKNNSTEFLSLMANLMFGPFQSQHMDHEWHKKLHKLDHIQYFPNELAMVYRTSLLLRGLAISLQINPSIGQHWRRHAQGAVDRLATNLEK
eukprot:CAMPEP_0194213884 /NCGR_PEP_ID=MMETSP0156-20130528/14759_1 /TAXON_ID=33649 /ORGANISM="Thalassionema nitzschioides, Strain L26-B" /LENGTH=611 /DNA_ID=CAMNT_0038942017 /DNA_START=57 /DNA_END=1892 /DNA_ORIENTATION=+